MTIIERLSRRDALVIFLLALACRLAWVLTRPNQLAWFDEREFAAIARHLAAGDGYVSTSFRANPTVAFYLGLVFRLVGENFAVARIGQAVVGALTCVVLAATATSLLGRWGGRVTGVLTALYAPHVYLCAVFYIDVWVTFFTAIAVACATALVQGRSGRLSALACGLALGLAILTRPAFVVFAPALGLVLLAAVPGSRRRRIGLTLLVALSCSAAVLPWSVRNYQVFGRPMLVSSGFWAMLWRGNHPLATGGPDDRLLDWGAPVWSRRLAEMPADERERLSAEARRLDALVLTRKAELGDEELAMDEVLRPLAIASLTADPGRSLRLYGRKLLTLFSAFTDTSSETSPAGSWSRVLAGVVFYPLLACAAIGAVLAWPRRREFAPTFALVGSVIGVYALLTACTRFRLPLDPFLLVFAALTLTRLARAARLRWRLAGRLGDAAARWWQDASQEGGPLRA